MVIIPLFYFHSQAYRKMALPDALGGSRPSKFHS